MDTYIVSGIDVAGNGAMKSQASGGQTSAAVQKWVPKVGDVVVNKNPASRYFRRLGIIRNVDPSGNFVVAYDDGTVSIACESHLGPSSVAPTRLLPKSGGREPLSIGDPVFHRVMKCWLTVDSISPVADEYTAHRARMPKYSTLITGEEVEAGVVIRAKFGTGPVDVQDIRTGERFVASNPHWVPGPDEIYYDIMSIAGTVNIGSMSQVHLMRTFSPSDTGGTRPAFSTEERTGNNDGRDTCRWCGGPTKRLDIGMGMSDMRVCSLCEK